MNKYIITLAVVLSLMPCVCAKAPVPTAIQRIPGSDPGPELPNRPEKPQDQKASGKTKQVEVE